MDRMMPIAVAFALGAVAASMVQFPVDSMTTSATGEQRLIEPVDTGVRYTLPADVAGLRVFLR